MSLGPKARHFLSVTRWWGGSGEGGDLRVYALHLRDTVPYTVGVRKSSLDKAVGQSLRAPSFLVSLSSSPRFPNTEAQGIFL